VIPHGVHTRLAPREVRDPGGPERRSRSDGYQGVPMKRLSLLLLLSLLPGPAAALAGGCPLPCSGQTASPPGSKLLYVQPDGARGELLAFSTATRQAVFGLPPGMAAADGRTYFTASRGRNGTLLRRWNVAKALERGRWTISGSWRLEGVSPNGRWAALVAHNGRFSRVLVFDAHRGRAAHVLRLWGNFEVETISRDGERLFLIEHLNGRAYNVRQYDLSREKLVADPLRSAGVKIMAGYAWSGVASPDGRWLLTLYLSTPDQLAFVHALDLESSRPACIFLSGGGFGKLKRYSLTLSPSGDVLYAANPVLGLVTEIDLAPLRVVRETRFKPSAGLASSSRAATLSTISRNGRTLYFSAGRDLWAYDTAYKRVRGPYPSHGRVIGVGYGTGDRQVFAVRRDSRMLAFDAATGRRMR
jgi:hypothetical protein